MKNPENIKNLNLLVVNYLTFKSLTGSGYEISELMLKYFSEFMISDITNQMKMNTNTLVLDINTSNQKYIPEEDVCNIVSDAYQLYNTIDELKNNFDTGIVEHIKNVGLNEQLSLFKNDGVETFKQVLFELLYNYSSYNKEYFDIKVSVLTNKMNEYAQKEYYENAAELKNTITEYTSKYNKKMESRRR